MVAAPPAARSILVNDLDSFTGTPLRLAEQARLVLDRCEILRLVAAVSRLQADWPHAAGSKACFSLGHIKLALVYRGVCCRVLDIGVITVKEVK